MILKKRLFAFFIDYFIIIIYAIVLWTISSQLIKYLKLTPENTHPLLTQLIGFLTLTIPVFFYFYYSEITKKGTIGKRKLNLFIDDSNSKWNNGILIRNIIKFLPWEIAHAGVHWQMYYSDNAIKTPQWVWMALIMPQILVIFYLTSIFYYKGESSVYDMMAGTRIKSTKE